MADLTSLNLTQYGSKVQAFTTQNGINTSSLVEMELSLLEQKFVPVENQLTYAKNEQNQWKAMQTAFKTFENSIQTLKDMQTGNKGVSLSSEIAFSITANSSAIESDYNVNVQQLATKHKILTTPQNPDSPLNKEGVVKINGQEFRFEPAMTLREVAEMINKTSISLTATEVAGSLILTSKKEGAENKIEFEDSENGILKDLGFINEDGTIRNEISEAKDAIITIDGVTVQSSSNKISNAISGVTFELKNTTDSPVKMEIGNNGTQLKDAISNFVKDYNKLVLTINEYTGEEKGLQGEIIMTKAKSDLNAIVSQNNNGYFFELGISLDGITRDGTIKLDETKLNKLIEEDYSKVVNMFAGTNGVYEKLSKQIERLSGEEGTITKRIETFGETIKKHEDTIQKYEESYERQKQMILNKYVQFEKQMATLNSLTTTMDAIIKSWNKSDD